ncbi:MAG: lactate utilization protein [Fimbriimonas sp.]|nr:lactate utilization protein [Fimbriimonas sp.]
MEDRDEILGRLSHSGRKTRPPDAATPLPVLSVDALWDLFARRLESLGGRIGTLDDLPIVLSRPHVIDIETAARLGRVPGGDPIWEAEVGVTTADLAIAETGTIVLSTGLGKPRLASLTPSLHVAIVPRSRIVATMAEAMSRLTDRTTVFVTGPSRTADIEGVIVRGVHGPGDVLVIPV